MTEKPLIHSPFYDVAAIARSIRKWADYLEHAAKNECEPDLKECLEQINELTAQIRRL